MKHEEKKVKGNRHRYEWFKNRIGKRVYRVSPYCPCAVCVEWGKSGFIIDDKFHAHYLHTMQEEAGYRYEDKPLSKITQSIE